MNAIEALKLAYPKVRNNQAVTGNIPMAEFEANESMFRKVMKANGLKVIYRGGRVSNATGIKHFKATMTRRCDATSVLLYRK